MQRNLLTVCPYCGNENHYAKDQASYKCTACALVVQLTDFEAEAKKLESAVLDTLAEQQTLDRQKELLQCTTLFSQAAGLQRNRQFDEAAKLYRQLIVREGNDPELYWRILMCHYCVEYQEGENGGYVPFILYPDLTPCSERAEYSYLLNSVSSEEQKAYYLHRLGEVERILSKYRQLRNKLQYDVFLSVKQSRNGGYTSDSDKASDLYDFLTKKGLKVFNSRRTPIPAGQEYEPYIIAALISSKVMIVVGSCPEHMEARWVKNEWSRFQWLQQYEKEPRLLFCYLTGGMSARDIPRELNPNMQAVIDGIAAQEKLETTLRPLFPEHFKTAAPIPAPVPSPAPAPQVAVSGAASSLQEAEALTRRGELFLEDGAWKEAADYFNKALDIQPELSRAYIGLVCVQLQLTSADMLRKQSKPFDDIPAFKKALRFASPDQREKYKQWSKEASLRERYCGVAAQLRLQPDVPAADQLRERLDGGKGVKLRPEAYLQAATEYEKLGAFEDAPSCAEICRQMVQKEQQKNAPKPKQEKEEPQEMKRKGIRKVALAVAAICVLAVAAFLGSGPYFYSKAEECLAKGEYWRAETFFENAGNYSDAEDRSRERFAEQYADEGNIPELYSQMVELYGEKNALKKTYQLLYRRVGYGDIARQNNAVFGIKANGTIISETLATETTEFKNQWKNVVAISCGYSHSIGLKSDGTVAAYGDNSKNQCDVFGWSDIVAISAGYYHTVGLKADGTVVATGQNIYNQCDVGSWKNVIAVFSGDNYTVGLCRDGSLLYTGYDAEREAELSSWQHVTNLAAGSKYTVGMTAGGESMVYPTDQKTVEEWTDLAYVFSTGGIVVGLKRDGTVVAEGENSVRRKYDVSYWRDIVYITTNRKTTLGLFSDDTLISVGELPIFLLSPWQNIGCTKTLK